MQSDGLTYAQWWEQLHGEKKTPRVQLGVNKHLLEQWFESRTHVDDLYGFEYCNTALQKMMRATARICDFCYALSDQCIDSYGGRQICPKCRSKE